MHNESFENFLTDILVRSFECHDWISEEMTGLNIEVAKEIRNMPESRRDAFRDIYHAMEKSLQNNVKILYGETAIYPESITYHKRFGWVLNARPLGAVPNEAKIFLGKLSLLEDTKISMGRRSYISGPSIIRGGAELRIGSFCSLAESLFINTYRDFHPMACASTVNFAGNSRIVEDGFDMPIQYNEFEGVKNGVIIGNDVWIARRVRISYGVTIGDGCIIAENSLVRKDCEPYGIYGGSPAKLIRYRFDKDVREQLLELRWWDWPIEKIQNNKLFFETNLTDCKALIEDLVV